MPPAFASASRQQHFVGLLSIALEFNDLPKISGWRDLSGLVKVVISRLLARLPREFALDTELSRHLHFEFA